MSKDVLGGIMGDARPGAEARERMIRGALIRIQVRRRGRRRLALVSAAAAAVVAVGIAVWLLPVGPARQGLTVRRASQHRRPASPGVWRAGSQPETHFIGRHRISLAAGARVSLERTDPSAARLAVRRGQADFAVQPVPGGGSFMVKTRQVLVEVLGTRFVVASDDLCSQVLVTEGEVRVTVRSTGELHRLGAGMDRTFCEASPLADELGDGGRMMRDALSLLAAGKDLEQVGRLLTSYLDKYPRGPFAEDALFHLVHTEDRLGRSGQARQRAVEFLRRFPTVPRASSIRTWLSEKKQVQ